MSPTVKWLEAAHTFGPLDKSMEFEQKEKMQRGGIREQGPGHVVQALENHQMGLRKGKNMTGVIFEEFLEDDLGKDKSHDGRTH